MKGVKLVTSPNFSIQIDLFLCSTIAARHQTYFYGHWLLKYPLNAEIYPWKMQKASILAINITMKGVKLVTSPNFSIQIYLFLCGTIVAQRQTYFFGHWLLTYPYMLSYLHEKCRKQVF